MKKIYALLAGTLLCYFVHAQLQVPIVSGVPQKFNYSTVVRDPNGGFLTNHFINLRFTMHVGSPTGPSVYVETDTVTTGPTGIFTVVIGGGSIVSGDFTTIPWETGAIYFQVEMDADGGENFVDMGTTQLLSFPYAISAGNGVSAVAFDTSGKVVITQVDRRTIISSAAGAWLTNGNSTVSGNSFIGTVDATDLVFKRNNLEGLRLSSNKVVNVPGKMGIGGMFEPSTTVEVNGALALRDTTITVNGNFTVNVGNKSFIIVNSLVVPSSATMSLTDGLVKGQLLVITISNPLSPTNGIKVVSNGTTNNTRIGQGNGNGNSNDKLIDSNTLTLLWNGIDWVQMASSAN